MPDSNPDPNSADPKKTGAFQISSEPTVESPEETEAHKFEIGSATEFTGDTPAFEDLGELPGSYFQDTLFLTARDPRWLFSYWDFDWSKYAPGTFRGGVKQFFLKLFTAAGADAGLVEINPEAPQLVCARKQSGNGLFRGNWLLRQNWELATDRAIRRGSDAGQCHGVGSDCGFCPPARCT